MLNESNKDTSISPEDEALDAAILQLEKENNASTEKEADSDIKESTKKSPDKKATSQKPKKKSKSEKLIKDLKDSTAEDSSVSSENSAPKSPSPIFSKPIFIYKDEKDKVETSNELSDKSNDDSRSQEAADEALEMLLDLQIEESDSEFEDLSPEIFSSQPFSNTNESENDEATVTEEFHLFADSIKNDEVDEENAQDDLQQSEPIIPESLKIISELFEKNENGENVSDDSFEEEPKDSSDVTLEEEHEENSEKEEDDLPPLMDIDHFSDYQSKSAESSEADEISAPESDNESQSESTSPSDANEAIEEKDEAVSKKVSDELDFQQTFFEYKDNLTILEDPVKPKAPRPTVKTEPKQLKDEKKFDPENPRMVDKRFDLIELFVFTLVAIMILTSFFFKHSVVEGRSMENTLFEGEHLIISDLFYTPEVGDIIVCEDYSTGHRKPLVKRIIALEGQTVRTDIWGDVYVDGKKLEEDYVYVNGPDMYAIANEWVVPEGEVFVLGDHRNLSSDSRAFGTVDEDSILGKVVLRFYPFDKFGTVD